MALNSSGPISLGGSTTGQSVKLEVQNSATATISFNDSKVRTLTGTSADSTLVMPTNFYGTSYAYTLTYLIIAGGGGGGGYNLGGGGGGGGIITSSVVSNPGVVFSVTVGAAGGVQANGGNSVFNEQTAIGGGAGASSLQVGSNGGSGGGGGFAQIGDEGSQNYWAGGVGTAGQGYDGGVGFGRWGGLWGGGGGGGAGSVGAPAGYSTSIGGIGVTVNIGGLNYSVGGGGGSAGTVNGQGGYYPSIGGAYPAVGDGTPYGAGAAGEAGYAYSGGGGGANAPGGSGSVVIAVPTSRYSGVYTGSVSVSTVGSNTILRFLSSGSYTT
jgi:hypothetical protein